MQFKRWGWLLLALLVPLGFALLLLGAPLNDVFSVGGDDGYELEKALVLAERPDLGPRVWNDQPWLDTMLVAQLFRWFGPNAVIPRVFGVVSLTALLVAGGYLLREKNGGLEILLLGTFFITANYGGSGLGSGSIAWLAASAMLEMPAVGWAMVAVTVGYWAAGSGRWWRRLLAGALFGAAAQIKLTALMLLPAFGLLILARIGWRRGVRYFLGWGSGFVAVYGLIAVGSPNWSVAHLWLSHYRASHDIPVGDCEAYRLKVGQLLGENPALALAALLGIAKLIRDKGRLPLVFAGGLLVTATGVAIYWRPWWDYYFIYFALPMSLLGAVGAGWVIRGAVSGFGSRMILEGAHAPRVSGSAPSPNRQGPRTVQTPPRSRQGEQRDGEVTAVVAKAAALPVQNGRGEWAEIGFAVIASAILAAWVGFSLPTFVEAAGNLHQLERASQSDICQTMRHYAPQTRWCFTYWRSSAFQAGVLIPPELVVLPWKRFWTGEITHAQVLSLVKQYHPEQLLIERTMDPRWMAWMTNRYVRVIQENGASLWIARSLHPKAVPSIAKQVKKLGL